MPDTHSIPDIVLDEKLLNALKDRYIQKRNKHRMNSNHYWRYSGKIEAINDMMQILKTKET